MAHKHDTRIFSRFDIILFIILVLIGAAVTVWIYFPRNSTATHLEIRQNGSIIMTLPLDTDTEQTITGINGNTNTFQIKDQTAMMLQADCGDHTCISTGRISRTGESIVCLPHRLVLQITSSGNSEEDNAPDAIVH